MFIIAETLSCIVIVNTTNFKHNFVSFTVALEMKFKELSSLLRVPEVESNGKMLIN